MPFPSSHASLLRALTEKGYTEPTPVQAAVLQPETVGRDLLVSAQTGSGKTVAFGMALAPTLLGDTDHFKPSKTPLALVVAPTRELALQVQRELSWLYASTGARVLSCVGGMDIRKEQWLLEQGAHIVVGTPGRLCDHLEHGRLVLSGLKGLVLDEADEMLDMGFRDELEQILEATPKTRRTLLFSATVPKDIESLARSYQNDAMRIATTSAQEAHGDITYRAVVVVPREREHAIVNILRFLDVPGALVFCQTREGVNHLHGNLLERGFSAVALSGELTQGERNRALQALRDGRARVCVATDVAARGLDLPDLGVVIHADMPRDPPTLLHRSGRTGRAGRKGTAVVLVPLNRRRAAERLMMDAHVQPTWSPPPSAEAIREQDEIRLVKEISAISEDVAEEDLATARLLLAERSPEQLAAALVKQHRSQLPAPEEVADSIALAAPRPERRPLREQLPFRPPVRPIAHSAPQAPKAVAPKAVQAPVVQAPAVQAPVVQDQAPVVQAAVVQAPTEAAEAPAAQASESAAPTPKPPKAPKTPKFKVTELPAPAPAPVAAPVDPDAAPVSFPAWFKVNVGFAEGADLRWILPMLCRRGKVGKEDIGRARIFQHETRFEVTAAASTRFAEFAQRPDRSEPHIRISALRKP